MRRFDALLMLATLVVGACSYLAQTSTAQAIANPASATRQLIWLLVGAVLLVMVTFADYRVLARFSPLFYVTSLAMLVFLLIAAPLRANTHSWLALGSYTIQPSEFARTATMLAVAAVAGEHRKDMLTLKVIARLGALVAVPMLLVVLQPDLGGALTFGPILLAVLWLGGIPRKAWVILIFGGVAFALLAWAFYLKPYQKERILTFADSSRSPYGAGYQQRQSKIAVGSGELTGRGLHSGTQSQLRFLPAQHTDFIFAVWAEETGFVGSLILIGAYALLVGRIFLVSLHSRDRVGLVLTGSVAFCMLAQIVVNVAMVTGSSPTTGITLPLMSYGGSSILATCINIGLVQCVWRLRYANV